MRIVSLWLALIMLYLPAYAEEQFCNDDVCKKIKELYYDEEYEKIIEFADPEKSYSKKSLVYIWTSYWRLAQKSESFEQQEQYFKAALEFGYYPAYLDLYYLYSDKDPQTATEFLKKYVATNPDDSDPYFLLGEEEFEKGNYNAANSYLKKAKELSGGHTAGLDWLLFKVNYILGDYSYAKEMLDDAFAQSILVDELMALKSDSRFAGIENRPEFKEYRPIFEGKVKEPEH